MNTENTHLYLAPQQIRWARIKDVLKNRPEVIEAEVSGEKGIALGKTWGRASDG